jgi:hypothetical protein
LVGGNETGEGKATVRFLGTVHVTGSIHQRELLGCSGNVREWLNAVPLNPPTEFRRLAEGVWHMRHDTDGNARKQSPV